MLNNVDLNPVPEWKKSYKARMRVYLVQTLHNDKNNVRKELRLYLKYISMIIHKIIHPLIISLSFIQK